MRIPRKYPPNAPADWVRTCRIIGRAIAPRPKEKRYPLQALLDALGATLSQLNADVRMNGESYRSAKDRGLTELRADRLAVRFGLHPMQVWSDWLEECEVPCAECGKPFVPSRKGHMMCSKNCRARKRKRERYASDPEFAERVRQVQRAYYAECGEYVRSQAAQWRAANPERVKAGRRAYYEAHGDEERAKNRERYHAKKAAA